MREYVRTLPLVAFLVMSLPLVATENGDKPVNLITIEPGRSWHLVGEWDFPEKHHSTTPFRYTFSILRLGHSYALVWDGDLIGGCCPWPQASPLRQLSDTSYVSVIDGTVFEILADSSLAVSYVDGRVHQLPATDPSKRFSATWR
jgi:hypothetical protein